MTLLEVLVVIAIIALLVSYLFPALQQAKRTTGTAVSTNNLRQMAIAVSLYEMQNDPAPETVVCLPPDFATLTRFAKLPARVSTGASGESKANGADVYTATWPQFPFSPTTVKTWSDYVARASGNPKIVLDVTQEANIRRLDVDPHRVYKSLELFYDGNVVIRKDTPEHLLDPLKWK